MNWALYAVAVVLVLSALLVIVKAGKPGTDPVRPSTGGQAATITVMNFAMAVIVVIAALKLS